MAIFPIFFLGNIGQENVFYDILERKNAFLGYKNKKFKKSKNWHFSKGVIPWFWSKNGHFSNFCFLGNIGQENAFLAYKNKKFIKLKNWHFSKGVKKGDGWKKVTVKVNSRCFKPYRAYSIFFSSSNVGSFLLSWILERLYWSSRKEK